MYPERSALLELAVTRCSLGLRCMLGFGASGSTSVWRREMYSTEQGGAFVEASGLQPALGLVRESVISHVLHLCPLKGPRNVRTMNDILERNEYRPWREGIRKLEEG